MVVSVREIKWNDVDANCKKKVAQYMYDTAQATFGSVLISHANFDKLWDNGLNKNVNTIVEDFYGNVGVTCSNLDRLVLKSFYSSNVAPIVA